MLTVFWCENWVKYGRIFPPAPVMFDKRMELLLFQDVPGCSRMFQDVPGCSRMIQDVPKIIWISAYKLSLSRMGMDASYMSGFCATMSGSVFMHRFRIVLGQCVLFIFYWTVALRSGNIFGLNTVRHFSDFFLTKVIQQQNNTTSIGPCFLGSYEIYMYFYYVVILLKVIKFRFRNPASVSIKKREWDQNKENCMNCRSQKFENQGLY